MPVVENEFIAPVVWKQNDETILTSLSRLKQALAINGDIVFPNKDFNSSSEYISYLSTAKSPKKYDQYLNSKFLWCQIQENADKHIVKFELTNFSSRLNVAEHGIQLIDVSVKVLNRDYVTIGILVCLFMSISSVVISIGIERKIKLSKK